MESINCQTSSNLCTEQLSLHDSDLCSTIFVHSRIDLENFRQGVWEIILFFFFTGPRALFSVILLCEIIKFEFFQICACCISLISIFFFFFYIYTGQKIVWWIPSQAMTGRPNMEFVYFYFFLLIVETWELEVANYVSKCFGVLVLWG